VSPLPSVGSQVEIMVESRPNYDVADTLIVCMGQQLGEAAVLATCVRGKPANQGKYVPIIDVFAISAGFVIRIFVGGIVTQTPLSLWIVIMTFLVTMFMGLAKRRDDVVICIETGVEVRSVVAAYNLRIIDTALAIMAAVTIVAYIMFTVSPDVVAKFHTDKLYLTTAFVVVGILRYLQIIFVEKKAGSPTEILLTDAFMQVCVCGWLVVFGLLIYTAR